MGGASLKASTSTLQKLQVWKCAMPLVGTRETPRSNKVSHQVVVASKGVERGTIESRASARANSRVGTVRRSPALAIHALVSSQKSVAMFVKRE